MAYDAAMTHREPRQSLDLRTTKCPLNFVQAKLALEKLDRGEVLAIRILKDGDSTINIPNSMAQEGHAVIRTVDDGDGALTLWIEKRL